MSRLLICFDVDGTLIDDTVFIWQTLHDYFETDVREREYWYKAYFAGKITYAEWARKDVEMWMEKGVDKRSIFRAMENLKPMHNAEAVISSLKEEDFKLGIVSGSLDIALEKALPNAMPYFDGIYLNRLVFDSEEKLTGIIPTPYDIENKAAGLRKMSRELDIPLSRTVFIGDNFNDVSIAKEAGLSIAFNCKSDALANVSDYLVQGKDISKTLPIIKKFAEAVS